MNISYFFRLSIGCHDVVPIIASGNETKQSERDEREESDGQSGEGLSPRQNLYDHIVMASQEKV